MARRTNLTLLAVLAAAFATGVASLWVAIANAALVTWLHGAVGLAVLALVPRKWPVAKRGLRRERRDRDVALLTAAVATGVLVAGIAHVAGVRTVGPVTMLGLHLGLALALLPLVVVHVVRRPQRPRRGDLTRAAFLRIAGLAALGVAAKWLLELGPAASRAATGSRRLGRPPATSWIDDSPPDLDPALWERRMAALPRLTVRCALDCTSGWYAVNDWSGVPLTALVGPLPPGTRSVVVRSATGYTRRFAPSEIDGLLLATHVDGSPISTGNGAPARLVAPGRRGFWWVK
jgi:hypothetical protein